jgi:hypothetical protein
MYASTPDVLRGEIMDCWHRGIDQSRTEEEVVGSARDFLALWSPRELEPLTQGWREMRIENAADIELLKRWAVEELGGKLSIAPGARELNALGDYLWHAAARIQEIRRVSAA